jgi:hypothetical protein
MRGRSKSLQDWILTVHLAIGPALRRVVFTVTAPGHEIFRKKPILAPASIVPDSYL